MKKMLPLYVSEEEHGEIRRRAKEAGRTMAGFVRGELFEKGTRTKVASSTSKVSKPIQRATVVKAESGEVVERLAPRMGQPGECACWKLSQIQRMCPGDHHEKGCEFRR
jgi:hypothetical protein